MNVARVARPEILSRLDVLRHAVLEASAGTGKTYALEHVVVELVLEREVPLEQILVVTFTDKATREMRERVRAKLRHIADAADDPSATNPWTIDDAKRRRLTDALAVFDRAPISTIHAFCQRVLTESAFDCARLLRQEQVESREAFGQAFREELRVALVDRGPLRPVLERALATWGADKLESSLYLWYAERGEPEPRFDRDAAIDALRKLPDRMELAPNGLAARLLEQGLSRNPKKEIPARLFELAPVVEAVRGGGAIYEALLSFWDWAQLEAPGQKSNLTYVRGYLGQAAVKAQALRPLAELFERLARTAGTPLTVLIRELLPSIVARLTGRKSARGHFDFDDMLRMLRDALYADGSATLAAELRRRYRVALVDEFQDTDRVQWDIFRRLFFEPGAERTLIVIGDPKQAIYGFRNADVHTYHAAKEEIVNAGGQEVALTECHRSTGAMIDAINRILAHGFFSGLNRYPNPVTCGRPHLRAIGPDDRAVAPITLLHFVGRPELRADRVRTALGEAIAREIGALLAGGLRVDRGEGPRALGAADIHVLCRSRGDAEAVGEALTSAGIPHAFYKQEGLFQTAAAHDAWVLLRALEEPEDRARRLDAWLTPFFAVPLERLGDLAREVPPEHPLVANLHRWRALAEGGQWAALFRALLEESGFARRELFGGASERRLTDVAHIFEVLLEETHRGRRSLSQLVARLGAFIEQRELPLGESGNVHRLESDRRAVQILTMHKSKGLEAEVVFLAGGLSEPYEDRLAPHVFHDAKGRRVAWIGEPTEPVRERMKREKREENERLLYVALTRARSRLYLPYFGAPPPDEPAESGVAYELIDEPEERPPLAPPQLSLLFDELAAPRKPMAQDEYELKRMSGPYRVLNDRLLELVSAGLDRRLFTRTVVAVEPKPSARTSPRDALFAWTPPKALLAADASIDDGRFARLRRAHAGFDVTSYTRMKRAVGGYRAPTDEEATTALIAESIDAALPAEDDLPGGAAVGVFLHEVLELLPFEAVAPLATPEALLEAAELRAILEAAAARHGVDPRHLPRAAVLAWRMLKSPLSLAGGHHLAGGLCSVTRRAAELPFLHPIPEHDHPTLAEPPPGPDRPALTIERGFVRGVIDLVIEHEGRYHVLDYKSDRLPSYDAASVALHVERNYLVQARLYTLGTLRTLAIHDEADYEARFGGLVYAFLRGFSEQSGVWVARPSFADVLAWERALREDAPWGYPLPPRRVQRAVTRAPVEQ